MLLISTSNNQVIGTLNNPQFGDLPEKVTLALIPFRESMLLLHEFNLSVQNCSVKIFG